MRAPFSGGRAISDSAHLLQQAAHSRRLAEVLSDAQSAFMLLAIAVEHEALALKQLAPHPVPRRSPAVPPPLPKPSA
jgi:hypothetical protein